MNKIAAAAIAAFAMIGAAALISTAHAEEDYIENNVKFKHGNTYIAFRDYTAGKDYNMVQVGHKISGFEVAYRYTESKDVVENRARITAPKIPLFAGIKLKPRVEVKNYDSSTKDDFINFQPILTTGFNITENLSAFIELKPKFAFGNEQFDDGDFYESQNDVGLDYQLAQNLSVGVFYEYNTDDQGHLKSDFYGTNVVVQF